MIIDELWRVAGEVTVRALHEQVVDVLAEVVWFDVVSALEATVAVCTLRHGVVF